MLSFGRTLASDLYRHRDLIFVLIQRDVSVRYRRSAFGLLWTMIQPLMLMSVLALVFSYVFRFQVENYAVYVLSGLLFWNFFSQSILDSMNSLRRHAPIVQKLPLPKEVFPVATIGSGVVNLVIALVPLALIMLVTGHRFSPTLLFLPVAIALAAIFTLGVGLLLSPFAVFFQDVADLIAVLLTLLMYMTPIIYPMTILPERLLWVIRFNPIRSVLEVFRDPIYYGKLPPLPHLAVAVAIAALALVIGTVAFRRNTDRIPFYL